MTKQEKHALEVLSKRLKKLASLENASFCFNKEEDEKIKKTIRPYMQWFEGVAYDIDSVLEMLDKPNYMKKYELDEIIRLNL